VLERDAVQAAVVKLLAKELSVDECEVLPLASIADDLGADSLAQVELLLALEEAFGIENIPDESADNLKTVQQVIEYVVQHGTKMPNP